jgi:predicted ATPase
MIKEFNLVNFKSYQSANLPLGALTVLVGANAAGKSNAIEGLRFLSWLAQGNKLGLFQYSSKDTGLVARGRPEDLALRSQTKFSLGCTASEIEWDRLEAEIEIRPDGMHISGESLQASDGLIPLYHLDIPSTGVGNDALVAYNNFSKGGNKPRITCNDQMPIFMQLDSPASFQNQKARDVIPPTVKRYQEWLANILFLDPVPSKMRDYSFPADKKLLGDGRNLSSVLYSLWGKEADEIPESKRLLRDHLMSFIQSLPEQEITTIEFLTAPRGEVMVQLVETFGGKEIKYDASLLSDGTLRVLAIAAAMLSASEGSLVVIEEIDNGVHPSRARHLLEQILSIANERHLRVLISTHNPAMLDALPDSAVPDVVFCYRDKESGFSRLIRLQDVVDYPELIAQGTLGHLMTSGVLEKFIKNPRTPEGKRQQALQWLDSLTDGGAK